MSPEVPETLRVAFLVVDALESLGVRYHLGGSLASSIHGVPRQTQDVDIVVALDAADVHELVTRLGESFHADPAGAREAIRARGSFNLIHLESGIKADLFSCGDQPFDIEEFSRGRSELVSVDPERRIFVKSPEDTILRKLRWYRDGGEASDRQWVDVLGVVRAQGARLDREYLRRWASELQVADLLERALGPGARR
jgi:hypothetical protein